MHVCVGAGRFSSVLECLCVFTLCLKKKFYRKVYAVSKPTHTEKAKKALCSLLSWIFVA